MRADNVAPWLLSAAIVTIAWIIALALLLFSTQMNWV